VLAPFLACSFYSYSSEAPVYGTTGNAASAGYQWVMTNVLPQQLGLTVNGVVYQYTTQKEAADDMLVHVQNENARGPGYIFRETDDWSGVDGNTINKVVPVPNIDISYWGNGSIEVEGTGSVLDPEVYYSYKYTPCEDPQSDPTCPGYIDPMAALATEEILLETDSDKYIQDEIDRKANLRAQKEEEERQEKEKREEALDEIDERLEKLLGVINDNMMNEQSQILHNALTALNALPQSYLREVRGGEYRDAIRLRDANLPDSRGGARVGLAQQVLHEKMVQSQYQD
jgi:hypothetical protein